MDQSKVIAYLLGGVVFLGILAFRLKRAMKSRPFNLKYVWVLPALFVVLFAMTLTTLTPLGMEWLWVGLSLLIGGAVGWFNGRTIHLSVDPANGAVTAKASPIAMIFIVALVMIRVGMRALLAESAQVYHLRPGLIQNAFMALALDLFLTRAIEMGLRARRLQREALSGVYAAA